MRYGVNISVVLAWRWEGVREMCSMHYAHTMTKTTIQVYSKEKTQQVTNEDIF